MRAALERRAAGLAVPLGASLSVTVLLLAGGTLAAAAVFAGGGAEEAPLVWIGGGAVVAASVGMAAALIGAFPPPQLGRAGLAFVGLLSCFVAWSAVTIVWSIEPDRSWSAFNRGLGYLALLVVGVLAGAAVRRAPTLTASTLAVLFAGAVLWALAGKVVPALGPDVERSARLRSPVGYWNALALLVAMSLPLWLWLASWRRPRTAVRATSPPLLYLSAIALFLTGSRGGVVVAAVSVVAWLALARARLEGAVAMLLALPPAAVVSLWALDQPGLVEAGAHGSDRSRAGALLGLALAIGGALIFAAALAAARRRPTEAERRRLGRLAAGAAVSLLVLALLLGIARVGHPVRWLDTRVDEFRNPPSEQVPQDIGRLGSFSSNNRWTWWTQAWEIFKEEPLGGRGARTFELARRPIREDAQSPIEPHNIGLQALSETGIVGFALLGAAAVAAVWAAGAALRRLEGEERAAGVALAAAAAAYLAHSLIDMGWEYLAVSVPLFLALGVLLSAGRTRTRARDRRLPAAAGAALLGLAALTSLASPWLAARSVDDAFGALERGDTTAAARSAERAAELNPLSIAPLHAEALAAEVEGDRTEADRLYVEAVELQPRNPATWFELGRFTFEVERDPDTAFRYLDNSYALDRYGPAGPLLDEVRAALEARGSG